jgi:hypothetical protein
MSEGNLGLVGAGFGTLALLIAAIGGGALVDELHNVKADSSQTRDRLNAVESYHDARLDALQSQHDASIEYLLDKHAIREKEIASLKKRLSKKPIVKPVVHEWHVYHDPHRVPYENPVSH